MKICLVTEFYEPAYGGQYTSVKWVYDLCKIYKINCEIIHKKKKNYLNKSLLIKIIKNSDIIHIFGGWTPFYIRINFLALKFKKKIIIHPLGFYESYSLGQKSIKKFIALKFYQINFLKKADYIHCASLNEMNSIKNLNENLKTVVLPFGVNNNFINKKINYKIKKRALFFSRFNKKKGLNILIKAWDEVNNKDWTLDIVGTGNEPKYLNLVHKKNITSINFLKPIFSKTKKKKLFNNYDFMVLPTINENFGIVILEALARGLPVLTTTGTPWIMIERQNAGWIINYSLHELKLSLHQIFHLAKKDFKIKKKNSIKVAKTFESKKIFKSYLTIYKKLIK